MEKRNLLILLLGGVMMVPTMCMAYPDRDCTGGDDEHIDVHRSPKHNPYVYISYNECNGTTLITFNSTIDNAEILVYQNGVEIDYQLLALFTFGGGLNTCSSTVKRYSTLLATYSITL